MSINGNRRLMIKIADMYYFEDLTQSQIAEKLGVYRTSVSRLLKKAREMGIVKIEINDRNDSQYIELEKEFESVFGLKEAVIVPTRGTYVDEKVKKDVAKYTVEYLKRILKDGDVLGVAWGTTLGNIANELTDCKKVSAHIVPLAGGPMNLGSDFHINSIVDRIANAFKAEAHFIYAPVITEKKETKEAIMSDGNFKAIRELWTKLNKSVVGIGNPNKSLEAIWSGLFSENDIEFLQKSNVAGDICTWFYDINGDLIESEINERIIAIELKKIKELEYAVGVATSPHKIDAVYGALKGKLINVLITDENTARLVLNKYKSQHI